MNDLLLIPAHAGRLDARPRPAAAPADLAALHRDADIVAARIAGDDLEPGAERVVGEFGKLIGVVANTRRTDGELLRHYVIPARHTRCVPGHAHADLVVGAADPGELRRFVLRGLVAQQRIERHAAAGGAERGAILRGNAVEIVRQPQAPRTLHV